MNMLHYVCLLCPGCRALWWMIGMVIVFANLASAGQVNWSGSAFKPHQTSNGSALDDSYVFELGAFTEGFTPSAENTAEWAQNWRVAQRSIYNPTKQIFAGSYVVESNVSPFRTIDKGYIWGYSIQTTNEWFLISSSDWNWPATGGVNPPESWTVSTADAIILGEVNPSGSPFLLKTAAVHSGSSAPFVTAESWRLSNFSSGQLSDGSGDWLADPDGDGKTNLAELGMGTNPLVAEAVVAPGASISPDGTLEMTIAKQPNIILEYLIEVSDDLVNWAAGDAVNVIVESANLLVVRDKRVLTGLDRRFIRLTFQLPN